MQPDNTPPFLYGESVLITLLKLFCESLSLSASPLLKDSDEYSPP